jgi:flagellar hook-associated protein 2
MKNTVSVDTLQQNFWTDLSTKLSSLQTAADGLRRLGGDVFDSETATPSTAGILDATVQDTTNATPGSYMINVTSLASYAMKLGSPIYTGANATAKSAIDTSSAPVNSTGNTFSASQPLSTQAANLAGVTGSSGTIKINNVSINWSDSDSLNSILARINGSGAGASATYDSSTGKVSITSATTGSTASLNISETSGTLLEGLQMSAGAFTGTNAVAVDTVAVMNSGSANMDTAVTAGVITVNNIKFYVDPAVDTINSVLAKINQSNAGVLMNYDSASGAIIAKSDESGTNAKITFGSADDTSNFLYAIGMSANNPPVGAAADTYSGTDAQINVGGGTVMTSHDNTVDGAIPGVELNLTGTGNTIVTVKQDTTGITTAVNTFVTAYNAAMTAVNDKLKEQLVSGATTAQDLFTGSMNNNSTLIDLKQKLMNMVTGSVAGLPAGTSMLEQVGISLQLTNNYQDNTLQVDATKLNTALSSNFDGVKNLIGSNTGVAQDIYTQLNSLLSVAGPITTETNALKTAISTTTDNITAFEARMAAEQTQLETQFSQMETLISSMKNSMAMFNAMTGTTTSASTSTSTNSTSNSSSTSSTGA